MDYKKIKFSDPLFKVLKEIKENENCFDCGKFPSYWVSVENGVFLCAKCAGIQRNFTRNKFKIMSTILDKFTPEELSAMTLGGNKNLEETLEKSSIDRFAIDKEALYNLDEVTEYRYELKNKVERSSSKKLNKDELKRDF